MSFNENVSAVDLETAIKKNVTVFGISFFKLCCLILKILEINFFIEEA